MFDPFTIGRCHFNLLGILKFTTHIFLLTRDNETSRSEGACNIIILLSRRAFLLKFSDELVCGVIEIDHHANIFGQSHSRIKIQYFLRGGDQFMQLQVSHDGRIDNRVGCLRGTLIIQEGCAGILTPGGSRLML